MVIDARKRFEEARAKGELERLSSELKEQTEYLSGLNNVIQKNIMRWKRDVRTKPGNGA